ncbi:MAG: DUF2851 family protein [Opitutaceae bacterium]
MRASPAESDFAVAEMQGLDGAFTFAEKLLQKIWLRGDFDHAAAATTDGRRVRILHPGKWNLLGGPDFTAARLRMGDDAPHDVIGDVEIHLHASDWDAHGHATDPAYANVALHVVLFPPEAGRLTRGASGRVIPVLALLPLLHRALEEFAADEAVESLANRPLSRAVEALGQLQPAELTALLGRHATARWRQKVHFARLRLQRLGWDAACHHTALEILGYRFNRAPMLRLAGAHPLSQWAVSAVTPESAYAAEEKGWSLQGVRPANHPRARLRQYAAWAAARPEWPARLLFLGASLPTIDPAPGARENTRAIRRAQKFPALRQEIAADICGVTIGGTRLETLLCDGFLPLLAAQTSRDYRGLWHHWFAGDLPPAIAGSLRALGYFDGKAHPACHGSAQGLLGWLIENEAK